MLAGHIATFSGKTATLPSLEKCGCPYQVVQFFLYIPNANLFSPTFTPMPSAIFFYFFSSGVFYRKMFKFFSK